MCDEMGDFEPENVWQPIETAPKEHGREILVCEPDRTMAVVVWLSREEVLYGEEEGFVSGWYISDGHNDPRWYRNWPNLTHWMPLPDQPLIRQGGGVTRTSIFAKQWHVLWGDARPETPAESIKF